MRLSYPRDISRNTRVNRTRAPRAALLLAAGAVAAACSSSPSADAPGASSNHESVGTASQALTQTELASFVTSDLSLILGATDFWGSTLAFSPPTSDFASGQIDFIPSSSGIFKNLASYFQGGIIQLPAPVVQVGGTCPTYTVSFTSLSTPAFAGTVPFGGALPPACIGSNGTCQSTPAQAGTSATLTPSGLQIVLPVSASVHLAAGTGGENLCPSANVALPSGTLTITLDWQWPAEQFTANVVANMNYNVVGGSCMDGLCDSIVGGNLGQLNSELGTQTTSALNAAFSNASIAGTVLNGLSTVLAGYWNISHQNDQGGGSPWTVAPGSLAYNPTYSEFQFNAVRGYAPAPQCGYAPGCSSGVYTGSVAVNCTLDSVIGLEDNGATPDPIEVYQVVNGARVPVFQPGYTLPQTSTWAGGGFQPVAGTGASAQFVACTNFSGGQTCDAVSAPVTLNSSACPVPSGPGCEPTINSSCQNTAGEVTDETPSQCGLTLPDGCGNQIVCPPCATCKSADWVCGSLPATPTTPNDVVSCGTCSGATPVCGGNKSACCPTGTEATGEGHCCPVNQTWNGSECATPIIIQNPCPTCGSSGPIKGGGGLKI